MFIMHLASCSLSKFNESNFNLTEKEFKYMNWKPNVSSSNLIVAIHGYNDYSNAFKMPADFLLEHNIETIAFDLRGFGKRQDKGNWFSLDVHLDDVKFNIEKIKKENPKKKIYLLGESMGGAIVTSLANRNKNLPIEGVILVAPAIWNFTEKNFFKKTTLKIFAMIFPNIEVSGKGIVKVQASDNTEMLEKLSKDKYFIKKPKLKSLNGIIDLMDESYIDAKGFFQNPSYDTIILIPLLDEIVPRKPIIEILEKHTNTDVKNFALETFLYEKSYHMILRDVNGNTVTSDIKDWIIKKNSLKQKLPYKEIIKKLKNTKFYHKLD